MNIARVLMVAPVGNVETAVVWYEQLLGRPADTREKLSIPVDGPAQGAGWRVTAR